jgi:hypothetical protein
MRNALGLSQGVLYLCSESIVTSGEELIGEFMWLDLLGLDGFWLDRLLGLRGQGDCFRPSGFAPQ